MKISVIVPVYNTSLYLKKCIDSLLNQCFTDYEIIVVNDGSTDNSQEILNEYNNNSIIKLYHKENGGLSDARNFGIQHATGDYFAFVDSDDWVEPDFLKIMYELAITHNADISLCNLQKKDENDIIFNKINQLNHLPEVIKLNSDFSLFGEISCFACNKLFKAELFSSERFPLNLHFEDIATIPRLILKSKIVAHTNEYLYNYFERRGSISQSFTKKGMDIFPAINMVKEVYGKSIYANNKEEWKRFVIYQGFYSFLAYVIRTPDRSLRAEMLNALQQMLKEEHISKKDIFLYQRLNKNYLKGLSLKKIIFYTLMLINPNRVIKYF